jgi:hypothetical protein
VSASAVLAVLSVTKKKMPNKMKPSGALPFVDTIEAMVYPHCLNICIISPLENDYKKARLPIHFGNPAIFHIRPVVFRPYFTAGLAKKLLSANVSQDYAVASFETKVRYQTALYHQNIAIVHLFPYSLKLVVGRYWRIVSVAP